MPSTRNVSILEEIVSRFSDTQMIITMRYTNVSAAEMDALRAAIRGGGGLLYIAKNTLVLRAAEQLGIEGIDAIIDGPTGYMTVSGDVAGAAGALVDAIEDQSLSIDVLGGVMDNRVIDAGRVQQLSQLPSREELLATLAASLNAPLTGLLRVMGAPVQGLAQALHQVADQRQAAG